MSSWGISPCICARTKQAAGRLKSERRPPSPEVAVASADARSLLHIAIVTLRAVPIQSGRVQLEVIDRGSGVPEQFRELIFQRFTQADMKANRSKGGSGLGLAIAKQMTERMGGKIDFESQPGNTRFFVALPGAAS